MSAAAAKSEYRPSAVILIPKQLRMDWTDVLMLDPTLSATDVRVAGIIGMHFGNKSGLAYLTLETIAAALKPDTANGQKPDITTAKRAVGNLERRGYLIVRRREIGTRTQDGRVYPVYGGKGGKGANEYLPAIGNTQVTATDRGVNLASRAAALWENVTRKDDPKQGVDALLSNPKQGTNALLSDSHSSALEPPKQGMGALPTLTSPSEKNSSRARGPSCANELGPAGEQISRTVGADLFRSWFSKLSIVSETDDTVTLSAPTPFHRDRVAEQFETKILEAWQMVRPTVTRIVVIVKGTAA